MKRLFLTSVTENVMVDFIKFLGKKPEDTRVAYIPTAANPYKNKWFIDSDRKKWMEAGFELIDVDIAGKKYLSLKSAFDGIDVIYVAGGNTFFLLQETMKSGFDRIVQDAVAKGVVYCGGSAGAVLAGPNIEPVKIFDNISDAPELKTFNGLGLVDFIVLPHYDRQNKAAFDKIQSKYKKFKFMELENHQAIEVVDDKYEVINV